MLYFGQNSDALEKSKRIFNSLVVLIIDLPTQRWRHKISMFTRLQTDSCNRILHNNEVVLFSIEINNNLSRLNPMSVKGLTRIIRLTLARRIIACGQIYDTIVVVLYNVFHFLNWKKQFYHYSEIFRRITFSFHCLQ